MKKLLSITFLFLLLPFVHLHAAEEQKEGWFWSKPAERIQIGFAFCTGYSSFIDSHTGNQLNAGPLGDVLSLELHLTEGLSLRTELSGGILMSGTDSRGNVYE